MAVKPNWAFEFRYSRKRLDNTIEDMAITDNLGFYIGNPGTHDRRRIAPPDFIPCLGRPVELTPDRPAIT